MLAYDISARPSAPLTSSHTHTHSPPYTHTHTHTLLHTLTLTLSLALALSLSLSLSLLRSLDEGHHGRRSRSPTRYQDHNRCHQEREYVDERYNLYSIPHSWPASKLLSRMPTFLYVLP